MNMYVFNKFEPNREKLAEGFRKKLFHSYVHIGTRTMALYFIIIILSMYC